MRDPVTYCVPLLDLFLPIGFLLVVTYLLSIYVSLVGGYLIYLCTGRVAKSIQ